MNDNRLNPNQQPQFQQQPTPIPPKRPWYKKWWIWVIIGVAGTCVISAVIPKNQSTGNYSTTTTTSSAVGQKSSASTEATTEKPTEAPTESKEDFINSCVTIDYKTLARNPDKHKGEKYKFTGKVIQVMDSNSWFDDSTTLRIEITAKENQFAESGYIWDDAIAAKVKIPAGEDRILEDDIIDFYGICEGLYTYKTVLGDEESVPLIDIHYFNIHE